MRKSRAGSAFGAATRISKVFRSRRWIVLLAVLLVAAAVTAVAVSAVVSRTVLADGTNLHFSVIHFVADDYDSGWIMHAGPVIVQVQQGSLQITQGSCTAKTVGPGETFIKTPFIPVRGVSTGRVVFTATFIVPYESPLIIPATNPCP
jgi:hypothetical protein